GRSGSMVGDVGSGVSWGMGVARPLRIGSVATWGPGPGVSTRPLHHNGADPVSGLLTTQQSLQPCNSRRRRGTSIPRLPPAAARDRRGLNRESAAYSGTLPPPGSRCGGCATRGKRGSSRSRGGNRVAGVEGDRFGVCGYDLPEATLAVSANISSGLPSLVIVDSSTTTRDRLASDGRSYITSSSVCSRI